MLDFFQGTFQSKERICSVTTYWIQIFKEESHDNFDVQLRQLEMVPLLNKPFQNSG